MESKGFVFRESQDAWMQNRGQEDKYTHPQYDSYFYIKRISDEDGSPYGFNAQTSNGRVLDTIFPHNAVDTFKDNGQFMWVDTAFMELMKKLTLVNSWVVSSIPATYNVEDSLTTNGEMDWRTNKNLHVGDIIYIHEVGGSRGRGGIIYATRVTEIDLTLRNKMDDSIFWEGQTYPEDISEHTKFVRLKQIDRPTGDIIPLEILKNVDVTYNPPQGKGVLRLSEPLKSFTESFFSFEVSTEEQKVIDDIVSHDNIARINKELEALVSGLPPKRVARVTQEIARNPKVARLIKERERYICEICKREPFIQKNGQLYAEADHVQPLGGASKGLDTPGNIRCLCAQCHRVITYGSSEVIRELLASTKWQV